MKNVVGKKIKKLRELRNYTQSYMAAELDITQQGYSKIEKEGRLTVDHLFKISTILDVDMSYILNFDENNILKDAHADSNRISNVKPTLAKAAVSIGAQDTHFYESMIVLLRKEIDCLYAIAFPNGMQNQAAINQLNH